MYIFLKCVGRKRDSFYLLKMCILLILVTNYIHFKKNGNIELTFYSTTFFMYKRLNNNFMFVVSCICLFIFHRGIKIKNSFSS